jgi:hypothetical protein
MIQVTLTPKTPSQLAQLIRLLEQFNSEVTVASTGEPVEVKVEAPAEPKKAKAPKAAPATTDSSPSSESASAPAPSETSAAAKGSAPDVTLEEVRAKLASLSQGGKGKEVKALLSGYGAAKLTDVPADKYAELLKNAEQL